MTSARAKEGTIVHVDVLSAEPKRTRDFLRDVFGWSLRTIPFAHYSLFEAPAPPHGGLRETDPGETPGFRAYVAVDSLDEARARIEKAGGRVLSDPEHVPGFGRFMLFEAPGRVVMAAFEER